MRNYTELRELAQADLSKRPAYLNATEGLKEIMIYYWMLGHVKGEHEGWKQGFSDAQDIALAGIQNSMS